MRNEERKLFSHDFHWFQSQTTGDSLRLKQNKPNPRNWTYQQFCTFCRLFSCEIEHTDDFSRLKNDHTEDIDEKKT